MAGSIYRKTHCRRFGYDEAMFAGGVYNEAFRHLLAAEVAEAEGWLRRGLPLVNTVPGHLRLPIALFVHGGLAILAAIREADYDVGRIAPSVAMGEAAAGRAVLVAAASGDARPARRGAVMTDESDVLLTSRAHCHRVARAAGFELLPLLRPARPAEAARRWRPSTPISATPTTWPTALNRSTIAASRLPSGEKP